MSVRIADPELLRVQGVDEHNLTHLSQIVVLSLREGKWEITGKPREESSFWSSALDLRRLGSKGDVSTRCIVVAKDFSGTMKGSFHEFPAKRVLAFIRELGLEKQDRTLRSDEEPALQDLFAEVGRITSQDVP